MTELLGKLTFCVATTTYAYKHYKHDTMIFLKEDMIRFLNPQSPITHILLVEKHVR